MASGPSLPTERCLIPLCLNDDPETDEELDALCIFQPSQVGDQTRDPLRRISNLVTQGQATPMDTMDTTEQSEGPSSGGTATESHGSEAFVTAPETQSSQDEPSAQPEETEKSGC